MEMIVYGAADFRVIVAGVPVVVAGFDVVPDVEAVEGGACGLWRERVSGLAVVVGGKGVPYGVEAREKIWYSGSR